jgi:ABC-type lipoprotein release transport system permease subunit
MKIKDYSDWILNEIKDSKLFTFLNILGIWINVFVVIIFLSLANGIDTAAVDQATRKEDVLTLQVSHFQQNKRLKYDDFNWVVDNKKIRQVIPVSTGHVTLKLYSNQSNSELKVNALTSEIVYAESYFTEDATGKDLRTESLKLTSGKLLSIDEPNGLIVSEATFNKLKVKDVDPDYKKWNLHIQVKKDEIVQEFKCNIVGVAKKTPYDGVLVYVASPLSRKVDSWLIHGYEDQPNDFKKYDYERFDFVTRSFTDLEYLRDVVRKKDYATKSILDDVDNIRTILSIVKVVFFSIIGISGLISAFNIVITLTSYILKRQKEIGILKALGATNLQIQFIYLFHSVCMCSLGSLMGAASAYFVIILSNILLSKIEALKNISLLIFEINHVAIIVSLSILIGFIAALIPSRTVSSIYPVEMIRNS